MKKKMLAGYLFALFAATVAAAWPVSLSELYQAPPPGTQTRWITPENPTGAKGAGGMSNRGVVSTCSYEAPPAETPAPPAGHGSEEHGG